MEVGSLSLDHVGERTVDVKPHPSPYRAWAGLPRSAKLGSRVGAKTPAGRGGAKSGNEGQPGVNRGSVRISARYACTEAHSPGENRRVGGTVLRRRDP